MFISYKVKWTIPFTKKTFTPRFDITTIQKVEVLPGWFRQLPWNAAATWTFMTRYNYIKSKQKKVSNATIDVYRAMKHHLQEFQTFRKKKITFSNFDFGACSSHKTRWYPIYPAPFRCKIYAWSNNKVSNSLLINLYVCSIKNSTLR